MIYSDKHSKDKVMYIELAILSLFVFIYSLIAGRLERSLLSGPIVWVLAGVAMGPMMFGWFDASATRADLRVLADLTLPWFCFLMRLMRTGPF